MVEAKAEFTEIDQEWLQLLKEAKNLGIEKSEVLDYLNKVKDILLENKSHSESNPSI
ncbi:anti-repressor SinI family protein [Cytobacillus sp. FJAT-53684]|uniref:Anti-repressor SinI family protein n=1 Tax=Cytobacillus mangrovibacter TaxID=3299024 RepID=A0ABW6JZI0_9BACI